MGSDSSSAKYGDAVIVVFLLAALLFATPFFLVWTAPGAPWYLPYLLWLGVILLSALVQRLRERDEL